MASSLDLSTDAIFEILSRLPLQTLSRCRLLSRTCRDLTYESNFMQLNSQRSTTILGYFVQSLRYCRYYSDFISVSNPILTFKLALDFLPGPVLILASTKNGLLLCLRSYPQEPQLYVCKPTTRQWIAIPNPNRRFFGGRFGMIVLGSDPLRFKVVRVREKRYSRRRFDGYNSFHIQVFDSAEWAWKQLETAVLFPFCEFPVSTPAASAGAALHWLTSQNNLFTFHGDSETWEFTSLPSNLAKGFCLELVEVEGKLGIIHTFQETDSIDLWIREDFGEKLCQKKKVAEMGGMREEHGGFTTRAFYSSDMATILGFNRLVFHNLKSGRSEVVRIGEHLYPETIFFFQSDFEPVNFEVMEKRKGKKQQQQQQQSLCDSLARML